MEVDGGTGRKKSVMAAEESAKGGSTNYISSFMSFLQGGEQPEDSSSKDPGAAADSTEKMDSEVTEKNVDDKEIVDKEGKNKINSENTNGTQIENTRRLPATEENKDSDFTYHSDESRSSTSCGGSRNVARRGKKRKTADMTPQRETPRRAARKVKCYVEDDVYNDLEGPDDPDYQFSDSDDDPDFDPTTRKGSPGSPEIENRPRRTKGGRGRGRGRSAITLRPARRSVENTEEVVTNTEVTKEPEDTSNDPANNVNCAQKRKGRPPTFASDTLTEEPVSDATVTDESKTSGKLSSAYNYATTRTRQHQAIRLPEGPNLTDEQLKLIESQFKSGDFVMAKKDTDMMENPPIWRIDGKSLLQKFQAFEKDGKTLYRNISTYSGWTSQAKALYVPVKVKFVFQSRYDTVVELIGFKGEDGVDDEPSQVIDKPVWLPKNKDFEITEELRVHMPSFEIYLQTLISQALDNNFLQEIYEENDSYFVDRVKIIDDLTEQRKKKILDMAKWDEKFQTSLDTWPCVNTMITKNCSTCQACGIKEATMLSQFYGQPYDQKTLRSKEPTIWDLDHKNFETCDSCSTLSQLYNKVAHQKYDYYSQCKATVTNIRVSQPNKSTTNVLRDLLANDEWITGLFRSMCTTWIKVDNIFTEQLEKEKKASGEEDATDTSVTAEKAANSSVTAEKAANSSVTAENDADSSVTAENAANSSVTAENVANSPSSSQPEGEVANISSNSPSPAVTVAT